MLAMMVSACQKSPKCLTPVQQIRSEQAAQREGGGTVSSLEDDLNVFKTANLLSDRLLLDSELTSLGDCKQLSFASTVQARYYVIAFRPVGTLGDNNTACIAITSYPTQDRWLYQILTIADEETIPATISYTLSTLCPNTEYEFRVLSMSNAPVSPLQTADVIYHTVEASNCE